MGFTSVVAAADSGAAGVFCALPPRLPRSNELEDTREPLGAREFRLVGLAGPVGTEGEGMGTTPEGVGESVAGGTTSPGVGVERAEKGARLLLLLLLL